MTTLAGRVLGAALVASTLGAAVAATVSPARAQTAALQRKAAGLGAIRADLDRSGTARVIVELSGPSVPVSKMQGAATAADRSALAAHRDAVRDQQDAVLNDVLGSFRASSSGIRRARMLPIIVLEASEAELVRLAADPRVKAIQAEGKGRPNLIQSVPLIGANKAQKAGATGSSQIVAVLDTGVQKGHEFIGAAKIVAEACFSSPHAAGETTRCPNGITSQIGPGSAEPCVGDNICDGHGTHVAGIAAGSQPSPDLGEPSRGVAPKASVFAIQVLVDAANGTDLWVYWSDLTLALDHVLDRKDDFGAERIAAVNASLGGATWTNNCDSALPAMKSVIDALRAAGVLTVIASGNNGQTNAVAEPGCISTAVTVGSTTKGDAISSFSNIGAVVDLLAPGTAIRSSVAQLNSVSLYESWSGTSMAAPHVAGAIAALRTKAPSATAEEIEAALEYTGKPIAGQVHTKPRIQLDDALSALSPSLEVENGRLAFEGKQGGPWKPKRGTLTVAASAGSIGWSVTGLPKWLDVAPDEGSVGTTPDAVAFSISRKAAKLRPGTYVAELRFRNTTDRDQPPVVRKVKLTVEGKGKSAPDAVAVQASSGSAADD